MSGPVFYLIYVFQRTAWPLYTSEDSLCVYRVNHVRRPTSCFLSLVKRIAQSWISLITLIRLRTVVHDRYWPPR